jgi:hypothetical protein
VDADTLATAGAVRAAVGAMRNGAAGGGCVFRFDGTLPWGARLLYPVAVVSARCLRLVGGCFLFCTRKPFDSVGGFCEQFYAAEEAAFIRALKKEGRFIVLRETVVTSGRKLRAYSTWRIVREAARWFSRPRILSPTRGFRNLVWNTTGGQTNITAVWPNQITGPSAGGPRQFPIPTPLAARVGQFCRSNCARNEIPGRAQTAR